MATKKFTKKDNYTTLLGLVEEASVSSVIDEEVTERLRNFIAHEIALLNKKQGSKAAPTKGQIENMEIKRQILNVLSASDGSFRSSDVAKHLGISVQKSTALLKQMVDSGQVIRKVEGKIVTFSK